MWGQAPTGGRHVPAQELHARQQRRGTAGGPRDAPALQPLLLLARLRSVHLPRLMEHVRQNAHGCLLKDVVYLYAIGGFCQPCRLSLFMVRARHGATPLPV